MGKGRKNAHNGRHPQDDDHYIDSRYIYDEEYEDPLYDDDDTYEFDDETSHPDPDQYPGTSRANRPRRTSRSMPPVYPRSRYGYQDDDQYPRRNVPARRATRPEPARRLRRVKQRRRSILPPLLLGCLLGVVLVVALLATLVFLGINSLQNGGSISGISGIPGITNRTYTQDLTQQVSLTQLQQIIVCDKSGNVTLLVDPNATKATITAHKTVQAATQSDANQQLQATSVEIQPPATISKALTCTQAPSQTQSNTATATGTPASTAVALIVNVTLAKPTNNSVNLTITLPPAALQNSSPSLAVDVEAQQGNITLTGLSGVLQVHGVNGNVTISHAILASGSQIETSQGNITFNGFLLLPTADTQQNQQDVHYMLRNEVGDINMTLPATTNLTLDANTNVGAIKSDFKINVNNNGGPVNYHGPLNPETGTPATATLVLDVSTGNVHIMKASS
jgi:hypothetical protein